MSQNTSESSPVPETGPETVPDTALLKYPKTRGIALFFVLMGIMMHTIDSTIANVALPHIQGSLAATLDQISWVITAYIVAAAIGTPAVAWLSARFGIKTVLLTSMVGFVLSSMLCGLALTLDDLVFYRILQGLSGAALIPVGQTIVLSCFKQEDYAKAMGLFGMGVMVGPIIGPTIGGYITEWLNWRWVFFVNLPFGLVALAGVSALIKDTPKNKGIVFDSLGFLSLITAVASFQMLMDRGHGEDWFNSWEIIIWAAISMSALYMYVVRTITAKNPFFDRRLFKDWNFALGNLVFFFVGGNMVVTVLMVPVVMQTLIGYLVDTAGLLLAPRGLGMMLGMMFTPRIFNNTDQRLVISIGLIITSIGLFDQAQMGSYYSGWGFARSGFTHGLGLGMVFGTLGALTFNHMDDDIRLQASTFFNMVRNIGQSFCAALASLYLSKNLQINSAEIGQHIMPFSPAITLLQGNLPQAIDSNVSLALSHSAVYKQAMLISYINNFYALALLSLLLIPIICLAQKTK